MGRRIRISAVIVAALVVSVTGSSFASAGQTSGKLTRFTTSPRPFFYENGARLASDGRTLWMASLGTTAKAESRLTVMRLNGNRWQSLPGRPRTESVSHLDLAAVPGRKGRGSYPCVSDYAPTESYRIMCFERGRWQVKKIPARLPGYVSDLIVSKGRVLALLNRQKVVNWPDYEFRTEVTVAQLVGDRFVRRGPRLLLGQGTISRLAQPTTGSESSGIRIGVTATNGSNRRWIEVLGKAGWSRSRTLSGLAFGYITSGPVVSGGKTFLPVNQDQTDPPHGQDASVYRLSAGTGWSEVGGEPLSAGDDRAYADLSAVGNRVWTIWSEIRFPNGRDGIESPAKTFAARINRSGEGFDQKVNLWRGKSAYPRANQVILYRDRPAFLYWRSTDSGYRLRATVSFWR